MHKRSLGKGLADLISGTNMVSTRAVLELELDRVVPSPFQPRRTFSEEELGELAASMRRQGVLQPLLVRETDEGYQIVAGERRWRAARIADLATVPCLVYQADDAEAMQIALIENLQREDLNAVEQARACRRLMEDFGFTQEELADNLGKSRSALANTLRLLSLPVEVQEAVMEGTLTEGHARTLLTLKDHPGLLYQACEQVISKQLSVRETEELVRRIAEHGGMPAAPSPKALPETDAYVAAAAARLQESLATRVVISTRGKYGGVIRITYHDQEELTRMLDALAPDLEL